MTQSLGRSVFGITSSVMPGGATASVMGTPHLCGRVRSDCPAPPDRELHGGGPGFHVAGTSVRVVALSNPVFDRVTCSPGDEQDPALSVPAWNHRFCTGPVVSLLAGPDSASGKAGAFVS